MTPRMKFGNALVGVLLLTSFAGAGETVIAESTFDDGPEGWELTVSTEWSPSLGNPGGCLFGSVAEPTNTTAVVFASDEFLGDWSSLDSGNGELRFDHALFSLGGDVLEIFPLNIVISGPGGVARWNGPVIDKPMPF